MCIVLLLLLLLLGGVHDAVQALQAGAVVVRHWPQQDTASCIPLH
jgi:hypothetical protein